MQYPNDEEPIDEEQPKTDPPVCPFCGGSVFDWGYLIDLGYVQSGQPGPIKFMKNEYRARDRVFTVGGKSVEARLCKTCGNLQLFADGQEAK